MTILFVFVVCLCASTVGGICGIGGGVVIKPLLDATGITLPASAGRVFVCPKPPQGSNLEAVLSCYFFGVKLTYPS